MPQIQAQNPGVKSLGMYHTLGRYDAIAIWEVPDKGAVEMMIKSSLSLFDRVLGETLVAIRRENGAKLLSRFAEGPTQRLTWSFSPLFSIRTGESGSTLLHWLPPFPLRL